MRKWEGEKGPLKIWHGAPRALSCPADNQADRQQTVSERGRQRRREREIAKHYAYIIQ